MQRHLFVNSLSKAYFVHQIAVQHPPSPIQPDLAVRFASGVD